MAYKKTLFSKPLQLRAIRSNDFYNKGQIFYASYIFNDTSYIFNDSDIYGFDTRDERNKFLLKNEYKFDNYYYHFRASEFVKDYDDNMLLTEIIKMKEKL